MKNLKQFIDDYQQSRKHICSNHIDYFINKTTFDYKNCLMVMKEMRKKLNAQRLDKIKIMIRVRCGHSKKIQLWGENFWNLVDATLTPPEIFIGEKLLDNAWTNYHKINYSNQIKGIEHYIAFSPTEDGFIRCFYIVEKEAPYV